MGIVRFKKQGESLEMATPSNKHIAMYTPMAWKHSYLLEGFPNSYFYPLGQVHKNGSRHSLCHDCSILFSHIDINVSQFKNICIMNIFRKKNLFTFVSALLLVMSGAVCASCGDDDEAASTSFDSSAFAGFWAIAVNTSANGTTDLHLLMYPDGHLVYYTTDINSKKTGTWSYNASQNVLATSISFGGGTLQWKIESTGSSWWSGVEQGNDGYLAIPKIKQPFYLIISEI